MAEKWDKRFDQLEQKIEENHKYLTDMMAQLKKIVGETNRKVTDLQESQMDHLKIGEKTSKTIELHKRKIADLEEEVYNLIPLSGS